MAEKWKPFADRVLDALRVAQLDREASVILIGSYARHASTRMSDVDILVLHSEGTRLKLRISVEMHLQQESRTRFLQRLNDGDDYPAWALRFGIPIHDPDGWWASHVTSEKRRPHWPDWSLKIDRAAKRIALAQALLDTGHRDAAEEECLYTASHIARAILLRNSVFPRSRPEMPSQLERYDRELSQVLSQLIKGDLALSKISEMIDGLRDRLERLSRLVSSTNRSSQEIEKTGAALTGSVAPPSPSQRPIVTSKVRFSCPDYSTCPYDIRAGRLPLLGG